MPPPHPLAEVQLARQWLLRRLRAVLAADPPDLARMCEESGRAHEGLDVLEAVADSLRAPVDRLVARFVEERDRLRRADPGLQWQASVCFTWDGRPHLHAVLLSDGWFPETRWLKRLPSAQDCRQAAGYGLSWGQQHLGWLPRGAVRLRSSGAFRRARALDNQSSVG